MPPIDLEPGFLFFELGVDVFMQREEQILHCNMPDTEDGVAYENQDEEPVAMIEESPVDVGLNLNCDGTFVISYVFSNLFH